MASLCREGIARTVDTLLSDEIVDKGLCASAGGANDVPGCSGTFNSSSDLRGARGGVPEAPMLENEREPRILVSSLVKFCFLKSGVVGALPFNGFGGNAFEIAVKSTLDMAADLRWA